MTATTEEPQPTVITIVLPPEGDKKPASLTIQQGDLGHMSTFQHDDFAAICRALNSGLGKLLAVQANPPGDVESAAKKVKPKTKVQSKGKAKPAKKDKPVGKPPYHLLNVAGKRRELITMTDPFEVTEKCMKNRKLVFKELTDAEEIAQMLVDAGETRITIVFKNGKTAKIVGEVDEIPSTPDESDSSADYPEGIESYTQHALYDHLEDVTLVLAIEAEVKKIKKYDWTNNLIKQREVKGAIHKHVSEEEVEDIYQIFFDIDHVSNDSEAIDDSEDEADTNIDTQDEKQSSLI